MYVSNLTVGRILRKW